MIGLDKILGNTKALILSSVGRNTLPETIYAYTKNFKDKALVTDYLDAMNLYSNVTINEIDKNFNIL